MGNPLDGKGLNGRDYVTGTVCLFHEYLVRSPESTILRFERRPGRGSLFGQKNHGFGENQLRQRIYMVKYHSLSFDFEGSANASQFDVAQTTARARHFDSQQPPP